MTTMVTVSHPGDVPDDYVTVHEHSVGGALAGLRFSRDDHAGTRRIKALAAALMEACHQERELIDDDGQQHFTKAIAQTRSALSCAVTGLSMLRDAGIE